LSFWEKIEIKINKVFANFPLASTNEVVKFTELKKGFMGGLFKRKILRSFNEKSDFRCFPDILLSGERGTKEEIIVDRVVSGAQIKSIVCKQRI
jgi:hypothetical protein